MKKYIKIYVILFKNWKWVFEISFQTTGQDVFIPKNSTIFLRAYLEIHIFRSSLGHIYSAHRPRYKEIKIRFFFFFFFCCFFKNQNMSKGFLFFAFLNHIRIFKKKKRMEGTFFFWNEERLQGLATVMKFTKKQGVIQT